MNHNGDMALAKKLIDTAVECGVDYIKFQSFNAKNLVTRTAKKAAYQNRNIGDKELTQYEMLKKLELSESDHHELIKHCESKNVKFWSTAFDLESLDLLYNLGFTLAKVPSGEITNLPYLRRMAALFTRIIISTGMSTLAEVEAAVNALLDAGAKRENLSLLHCTSEYPAPFEEVNLLAMVRMKQHFNLPVGYSDHTQGIAIPIAAVAMGATIIEKHFTLDRNLPGPDHKASLEPYELKLMVESIRNVERAFGNGEKVPTQSEMSNLVIARKSIVARCQILAGETITIDNITVKRPGTGISPMEIDSVIGKKASVDIHPEQPITISMLT